MSSRRGSRVRKVDLDVLARAPFQKGPAKDIVKSITAERLDGYDVFEMFYALPTRRELPEYYQVISSPMDLNTINQKITQSKYPTFADLYNDLALMVENAKTFNRPDSQIYADAVAIHGFVEKHFAAAVPKLPQGSRAPSTPTASSQQKKMRTKKSKDEEDVDVDDKDVEMSSKKTPRRGSAKGKRSQQATPHTATAKGTPKSRKKAPKSATTKGVSGRRKGAKDDLHQESESSGEGDEERKPGSTEEVEGDDDGDDDGDDGGDDDDSDDEKKGTNPRKRSKHVSEKTDKKQRRTSRRKGAAQKANASTPTRLKIKIGGGSVTTREQTPEYKSLIKTHFSSIITSLLAMEKYDVKVSDWFYTLPTKAELPVYYETITDPVDLQQIEKHIASGKISTFDDLETRLKLMCANAKTFNRPTSPLHRIALYIEKQMRSLLVKTKMIFQEKAKKLPKPVSSSASTPSTGGASRPRLVAKLNLTQAASTPSTPKSTKAARAESLSSSNSTAKKKQQQKRRGSAKGAAKREEEASDAAESGSEKDEGEEESDDEESEEEDEDDGDEENDEEEDADEEEDEEEDDEEEDDEEDEEDEDGSSEDSAGSDDEETEAARRRKNNWRKRAKEREHAPLEARYTVKLPKGRKVDVLVQISNKKYRIDVDYIKGRGVLAQCQVLKNNVRFSAYLDGKDWVSLSDAFMRRPPKSTPDYYKIILVPISIREIQSKIDSHAYLSFSECVEDFHLMCQNSLDYNEPGSPLYDAALIIKRLVDIKAKEINAFVQVHMPPPEDADGAKGKGRRGSSKGGKQQNGGDPEHEHDQQLVAHKVRKPRNNLPHAMAAAATDDVFSDKTVVIGARKGKKKSGRSRGSSISELPSTPPFYESSVNESGKKDEKDTRAKRPSKKSANDTAGGKSSAGDGDEDDGTSDESGALANTSFPKSFLYHGTAVGTTTATVTSPIKHRYTPHSHFRDPSRVPLQYSVNVVEEESSFFADKELCNSPFFFVNPKSFTESKRGDRKFIQLFMLCRAANVVHNSEYALSNLMVLPSEETSPEYYLTVDNPIDCETIFARVHAGEYKDNITFSRDFCKMVNNAIVYDGPSPALTALFDAFQWEALDLFTRTEFIQCPWLKTKSPLVAVCEEIIQNLHELPGLTDDSAGLTDAFLALPDPATFEDYYRVIEVPMTISMIHTRVLERQYTTLSQFVADFRQMFANARTFNEAGSDVLSASMLLEKHFVTLFEQSSAKIFSPSLDFNYHSFVKQLEDMQGDMFDVLEPDEIQEGEMEPVETCVSESGVAIVEGEYVLVKNRGKQKKPHVCLVEATYRQKASGKLFVKVERFYRPEDTFHVPTRTFYRNEVLVGKGNTYFYSVARFLRKCAVVWVRDYLKFSVPGFVDEDVFIVESRYHVNGKSIKPIKSFTLPSNKDALIPRDKSLSLSSLPKVKSIFHEDYAKEDGAAEGTTTSTATSETTNADASSSENARKKWQEDPRNEVLETDLQLHAGRRMQSYLYFRVFCIGGTQYKIGDCVYVRSGHSFPYIAQIYSMWLNHNNEPYCKVTWFCYPEETVHVRDHLFYRNEVMESRSADEVHMATIISRCCILNSQDAKKTLPLEFSPMDIYICEMAYSKASESFRNFMEALPDFSFTNIVEYIRAPGESQPLPTYQSERAVPKDAEAYVKKPIRFETGFQLYCRNLKIFDPKGLKTSSTYARTLRWKKLPQQARDAYNAHAVAERYKRMVDEALIYFESKDAVSYNPHTASPNARRTLAQNNSGHPINSVRPRTRQMAKYTLEYRQGNEFTPVPAKKGMKGASGKKGFKGFKGAAETPSRGSMPNTPSFRYDDDSNQSVSSSFGYQPSMQSPAQSQSNLHSPFTPGQSTPARQGAQVFKYGTQGATTATTATTSATSTPVSAAQAAQQQQQRHFAHMSQQSQAAVEKAPRQSSSSTSASTYTATSTAKAAAPSLPPPRPQPPTPLPSSTATEDVRHSHAFLSYLASINAKSVAQDIERGALVMPGVNPPLVSACTGYDPATGIVTQPSSLLPASAPVYAHGGMFSNALHLHASMHARPSSSSSAMDTDEDEVGNEHGEEGGDGTRHAPEHACSTRAVPVDAEQRFSDAGDDDLSPPHTAQLERSGDGTATAYPTRHHQRSRALLAEQALLSRSKAAAIQQVANPQLIDLFETVTKVFIM